MKSSKKIPVHSLNDSEFINVEKISHPNHYNFKEIHRHDYFEILFFFTGGGYQTIDFKKYPILDYSCYIIKPRQVHLVKRENKADGLLIQFTENTVLSNIMNTSLSIIDRLNYQPIIFENNKSLNEIFLNTLKNIKQIELQKTVFYKQRIVHELCAFLFKLEEFFLDSNQQKLQTTNNVIAEFSKLIDIHMNNLSIKEYADLLNTTPKKLIQITKKQLGLTPLKYIHQKLLTEIKRDLTFKEVSHKEIAYQYNFDSPSNFSLFVKSQTGLNPSELQKQLLKNYEV